MNKGSDSITMLGTGNALVTRCNNTCFTLHSASGALLLVDAGSGNGILRQRLYSAAMSGCRMIWK